MKCNYCGTENLSEGTCPKCGASITKPDFQKSEPFFYNGYICYSLRYLERDTREVQFWLGNQLVERIEFTLEFMKEFIKEWEDAMPFIWELFLLARGEQEVVKYQEMNSIYPATFEIRRIESSKKKEIQNFKLCYFNQESFHAAVEAGFVKI